MKTRYIILIVIAFVLIIAAITNPAKETHKDRVKKELASTFADEQNPLVDIFSQLVSGVAVEYGFDKMVEVDNYVFFSITRIKTPVYSKTVGMGLFSNVFLFGSLKDLVADIRKQSGL